MKLYDILACTEEKNVELVSVEENRRDADGRVCGLILRCPEGSSLFSYAQAYGIGNLDVIEIGMSSASYLRLIVKS